MIRERERDQSPGFNFFLTPRIVFVKKRSTRCTNEMQSQGLQVKCQVQRYSSYAMKLLVRFFGSSRRLQELPTVSGKFQSVSPHSITLHQSHHFTLHQATPHFITPHQSPPRFLTLYQSPPTSFTLHQPHQSLPISIILYHPSPISTNVHPIYHPTSPSINLHKSLPISTFTSLYYPLPTSTTLHQCITNFIYPSSTFTNLHDHLSPPSSPTLQHPCPPSTILSHSLPTSTLHTCTGPSPLHSNLLSMNIVTGMSLYYLLCDCCYK